MSELPEPIHRMERHAHLSDLGVLAEVDRRDEWDAELVEGSCWPDDRSVIVLRCEAQYPLFCTNLLNPYGSGTYDYSEPIQVEVRITRPARPFTLRAEEAIDGA